MSSPAAGLLLAAGAGRRMGRAKALVTGADGMPWVRRGVDALRAGGCRPVLVTTGAEAERVESLLDAGVEIVRVDDWSEGMGASLRAGLAAADRSSVDRVLVSLVDLVDVGPEVMARVLRDGGDGADALARASYHATPGHPVLLGRDHWRGVADAATGDRGARTYLSARRPRLIECGDLATGRDVDRPSELDRPE